MSIHNQYIHTYIYIHVYIYIYMYTRYIYIHIHVYTIYIYIYINMIITWLLCVFVYDCWILFLSFQCLKASILPWGLPTIFAFPPAACIVLRLRTIELRSAKWGKMSRPSGSAANFSWNPGVSIRCQHNIGFAPSKRVAACIQQKGGKTWGKKRC